MYSGWYLIAFESELVGSLTPVSIGDRRLVLVCDGERVRAFDAICPHRGANLGFGGRLDGDAIVCPFHGKRVIAGERSDACYWVREYPILCYGGMFFVRCSNEHENGLGALLEHLVEDHVFITCFALPMRVEADLVTENAFDETHFRPVHGVRTRNGFAVQYDAKGALIAETTLEVPVSQWQLGDQRAATVNVPFAAYAFSPHVVASHVGGDNSYWAITGATPEPGHGCVVRFALAVPSKRGSQRVVPSKERIHYLVQQSRGGLEQDQVVWENLRRPAQPRYAPEDGAVISFRNYCEHFAEPQ